MFRAIGFVIGLIAIRVLMPGVFHALEQALIMFFSLISHVFASAPQDVTQFGAVGYAGFSY
jgi:hypothetical protein